MNPRMNPSSTPDPLRIAQAYGNILDAADYKRFVHVRREHPDIGLRTLAHVLGPEAVAVWEVCRRLDPDAGEATRC